MEVRRISGTSEGLHSSRDVLYGRPLSTRIFPPRRQERARPQGIELCILQTMNSHEAYGSGALTTELRHGANHLP